MAIILQKILRSIKMKLKNYGSSSNKLDKIIVLQAEIISLITQQKDAKQRRLDMSAYFYTSNLTG